jgi:hypothetical protein
MTAELFQALVFHDDTNHVGQKAGHDRSRATDRNLPSELIDVSVWIDVCSAVCYANKYDDGDIIYVPGERWRHACAERADRTDSSAPQSNTRRVQSASLFRLLSQFQDVSSNNSL